jgi:hypothetical protein
MPTYQLLCQKHDDWEAGAPIWQEVSDLYSGGYTIRNAAKRYLPRMQSENPVNYEERIREASFIGYLGQIVDFFGANLFGSELVVTPPADAEDGSTIGELPDVDYYTALAENCDRKGTKFASFMRGIWQRAALKRRGIVGIDFPAIEATAASRAEEDALGKSQAYLYEVPVEQLINWGHDDAGNFRWVVLHRLFRVQAGPFAPKGVVREEWKVWTREEPGRVRWTLYAIEHNERECLRPEQEIPEVASGDTSFAEIPLYEFALPEGLWIGNKIGPMQCEHFRTRSTLKASEARSLFEIPYYKLGSEMGAPGGDVPSEVQQNPYRAIDPRLALAGKGFAVLGADDELGFAGPSGAAYQIVDKQLSDLKDEMFRVVHQMAAALSNGSASLGRSGLSKQEDRRAEAIVLGEFGRMLREFAVKVYTAVSAARGEDTKWVAHGLDRFVTTDRLEVMQEATQSSTTLIPSQTFRVEHLTRLANALVDLTPALQATVRQEIEDGVKKEAEAAEHLHEIAAKASRDMGEGGEESEDEGGDLLPKGEPTDEE